jgi:hypothetical protein
LHGAESRSVHPLARDDVTGVVDDGDRELELT